MDFLDIFRCFLGLGLPHCRDIEIIWNHMKSEIIQRRSEVTECECGFTARSSVWSIGTLGSPVQLHGKALYPGGKEKEQYEQIYNQFATTRNESQLMTRTVHVWSCFHHVWFNDGQILRQPVRFVLLQGSPDLLPYFRMIDNVMLEGEAVLAFCLSSLVSKSIVHVLRILATLKMWYLTR